ncbi:SNF2-related protein [Mumia xiangluensis]|uniref:SNF2-related protein n=1 Tax=Mumia xiangluensis TaxID=1678900 RepID=A0ABW1QR18_9ACTN
MLTLDDLADEALLRLHIDAGTIARGRTYARDGYVIDLDVARNRDGYLLQSSVAGTSAASYQTVVSARSEPGQPIELYTACSCPVSHWCKHAVATVLVARDRAVRAESPAGDPGSRWTRVLDDLLDDAGGDDSPSPRPARPGQELALRVEAGVSAPQERRFGRAWAGAVRPALRLRPVTRGRRGTWVKTGVGWRDLVVADPRDGRFVPEHLDVLRAIHGTHRARYSYGFGSEDALPLNALGGSLWRLLREAGEVGLPVVASGFGEVRIAPQPARVSLDARADGNGGAVLVAGAAVGGAWRPADDVAFLGTPEHGVALWDGDGDDAVVTLAPLDRPLTPAVKELLAARAPVTVPPEGMDELRHTYLPRVGRLLEVTSRDDSVHVPDPPAPHLVLATSWVGGAEARLSWAWHYRSRATGETVRVFALDDEPAPYGMRDTTVEAAVLAGIVLDEAATVLLLRAGTSMPSPYPELVLREMDAVRFAHDVLPGLRANAAFEVQVDGHEPTYAEVVGKPEISFTTAPTPSGRTDWLDLEVVVSIGGRQVGLATIIEAIATGQDKILLHKTDRKGTYLYVSVDHPELDALARMLADARALSDRRRDEGTMSVATSAFDLWDELDEIGVVDAQAARWVALARRLAGSEGVPELEPPAGLKATLRPYQREGFSWLAFLAEHGLGGILADDMGLGKTVQAIALITHARERDPGAPPFLVVAPTSVVATWAGEAAAFAPGLVVRTVTESAARRRDSLAAVAEGADIVVTSYTLLRIEADDYVALPWSGRILDEAQAVKNHRGKTYQAVRRVDAPFSLAITGTPVENDLMELWSLLSLTAPGLFPHPNHFSHEIAKPIEKGEDTELLAMLKRRIRPIMLRRTKELVAADLPPKQEQVLEVALSARHRKLYDTHLQRERQRILGLLEEAGDDEAALRRHRITIFAALTRLRQLSLDPALVDERYEGVGSAKTDLLVDHIHELAAEGHRALVFSQFTTFLRRVQARLEREGIDTAYLDGSTRDRAAAVDGFKTGDQPVFLISLKAGGVGLTLTEADYVFVLDPWWNPAVEAQAVDRAHRIGQESPVMVYRLVSAGTIEDKVVALKARKAELVAGVLDDEALSSGALTAGDLAGLFDA